MEDNELQWERCEREGGKEREREGIDHDQMRDKIILT
jgi:hypothetical protein